MLVPFVHMGIWKSCAVPCPTTFKCITPPPCCHTYCPCRTKGKHAALACLHSWLYSYHSSCKPHSWLHYNRWLEHSLFNKFPPLGSNIRNLKRFLKEKCRDGWCSNLNNETCICICVCVCDFTNWP